jgi:hypothetical protein
LLEVSGLAPARVERGDLLRIVGAGFPSGRSARLRLDGIVRRPAEIERTVDVTLTARAVSPERVDLRVDDALLGRLGGGGTFRGRVEVEFDAAVPSAEPVSGAHDGVVVLFVAPTSARLSTELAHARSARELLAFLGVLRTSEADTDGVRLERLEAGSRGAAAGLRAGDVVTESGGALVTSIGDLAPRRATRSLSWRVTRTGESAPLPLTISLRGLGGAPDPEWSWAAALVALLWLALLFRVAPTARLVGVAHRALCTARRAATSRADVVGALLAGGLAALVAAAPRLPTAVDFVALYGALVALRFTSAFRGGALGRRGRLARALSLEGAAGLALTALLAHAGTVRFAGVAAAQALAPLTFGLLAGPVSLVASLLWLRVACVPASAEASGREVLFDGESTRRSLAVALLALVAFGGASSTDVGAHYALGALVVGPLAIALSLSSSRFRGLGPVHRPKALLLGVGTVSVALGLVAVPLPAAVDDLLAKACVAVVLGAALLAVGSLWRRPSAAALRAAELG